MTKSRKVLSQREIVLGFVTLAVLGGGFFKYSYSARQKNLAEQEIEIATLLLETERNKNIATELQKRSVASAHVGEKDPQVQKYLANTQRFAQIISDIASIDKRLLAKSMQLEKNEKTTHFSESLFMVQLEGDFLSIGGFVERLEQSSLLAEIEEFEISRVESDLTRLVAKMKIRAYSQEGSAGD